MICPNNEIYASADPKPLSIRDCEFSERRGVETHVTEVRLR